jgi:hypothetical protein
MLLITLYLKSLCLGVVKMRLVNFVLRQQLTHSVLDLQSDIVRR